VAAVDLTRAAGGDVTLRVWDGMLHCFAFFAPLFMEARAGMRELGTYISQMLSERASAG